MKYVPLALLILMLACTPDRSAEQAELVSRLRASSDLATVEMVFTKVVRGSKTSTFLGIPTGTSDFLAETEAHVKAGIDLSKVEVGAVDWETGEIQLILPPPHIISIDIPAESFRVNEEITQNHYWSELSSEDMDAFYQQAEREVRLEVKRLNPEQMARDKTEAFLEQLLLKRGFQAIQFSYQSSSDE